MPKFWGQGKNQKLKHHLGWSRMVGTDSESSDGEACCRCNASLPISLLQWISSSFKTAWHAPPPSTQSSGSAPSLLRASSSASCPLTWSQLGGEAASSASSATDTRAVMSFHTCGGGRRQGAQRGGAAQSGTGALSSQDLRYQSQSYSEAGTELCPVPLRRRLTARWSSPFL